MIKNLLIFILSIAVIWLSLDKFYTQTKQHITQKLTFPIEEANKTLISKVTKKPKKVTLYLLEDRFDEALLWLTHNPNDIEQGILERYILFKVLQEDRFSLTYLQSYLLAFPKSYLLEKIVTILIEKKAFIQVIDIILEHLESSNLSPKEERLKETLRVVSQTHLTQLTTQNPTKRLSLFYKR